MLTTFTSPATNICTREKTNFSLYKKCTPTLNKNRQFVHYVMPIVCNKIYASALQPFLLWCTLEDVLTNSCTLFTLMHPIYTHAPYLHSCTLFTLMHPIYTHAPYLLKRPPCPPYNCAYVCKYPGLNKQIPQFSNSGT